MLDSEKERTEEELLKEISDRLNALNLPQTHKDIEENPNLSEDTKLTYQELISNLSKIQENVDKVTTGGSRNDRNIIIIKSEIEGIKRRLTSIESDIERINASIQNKTEKRSAIAEQITLLFIGALISYLFTTIVH